MPGLTPAEVDRITEDLLRFVLDAQGEVERRLAAELSRTDRPVSGPATRRFAAIEGDLDAVWAGVNGEAEAWLNGNMGDVWGSGAIAAADDLGVGFSWTQAHIEGAAAIAQDTYDEVLAATRFVRRNTKTLIRRMARQQTARAVLLGDTRTQAARMLAQRLAVGDLVAGEIVKATAITYRDGSRHTLGDYTEMLMRTQVAKAQNGGLITQTKATGVKWVEVFDGADCGAAAHDDPEKANGAIWPIERANDLPIAHPRCLRSFGPRPDITSERQAADAKPSTTAAQRRDQELFERRRARARSDTARRRRRRSGRTGRTPRSRRGRRAPRASERKPRAPRTPRGGEFRPEGEPRGPSTLGFDRDTIPDPAEVRVRALAQLSDGDEFVLPGGIRMHGYQSPAALRTGGQRVPTYGKVQNGRVYVSDLLPSDLDDVGGFDGLVARLARLTDTADPLDDSVRVIGMFEGNYPRAGPSNVLGTASPDGSIVYWNAHRGVNATTVYHETGHAVAANINRRVSLHPELRDANQRIQALEDDISALRRASRAGEIPEAEANTAIRSLIDEQLVIVRRTQELQKYGAAANDPGAVFVNAARDDIDHLEDVRRRHDTARTRHVNDPDVDVLTVDTGGLIRPPVSSRTDRYLVDFEDVAGSPGGVSHPINMRGYHKATDFAAPGPTTYGSTNTAEDFAETWRLIMEERHGLDRRIFHEVNVVDPDRLTERLDAFEAAGARIHTINAEGPFPNGTVIFEPGTPLPMGIGYDGRAVAFEALFPGRTQAIRSIFEFLGLDAPL